MADTQHTHHSTSSASDVAGTWGEAHIALRWYGTAVSIAAKPYTVFYSLTDGEGCMTVASRDEAVTLAQALVTHGFEIGVGVAYRARVAQAVR